MFELLLQLEENPSIIYQHPVYDCQPKPEYYSQAQNLSLLLKAAKYTVQIFIEMRIAQANSDEFQQKL